MKLKRDEYLNIGDYQVMLENLWNRINEIEDLEIRVKQSRKVCRALNRLWNLELSIVDYLHYEKSGKNQIFFKPYFKHL